MNETKSERCIVRIPLAPCYECLLRLVEEKKAAGAGKRQATRAAILTEIITQRLEQVEEPGRYRLSNKAELYAMDRDRSDGKKASPQITIYLTQRQSGILSAIVEQTGRWKSEIITGMFVDELSDRGMV